jgi:uncharacterized BrkB/YihY/UPF0761 family membrane protein
MPSTKRARPPCWYSIPVRVLLFTFIGTLIAFAVSLFLGIVGTFTIAVIRKIHPDMSVAYRQIAIPCAAVVGSILFVLALTMEIRHYRQTKTLVAIERMT